MVWIKLGVHKSHPKILAIANEAGVTPEVALAAAVDWFRWVDINVDSIDENDVERVNADTPVTSKHFSEIINTRKRSHSARILRAFCAQNWTEIDPETRTIRAMDMQAHFGKDAKRRASEAKRKAYARAGRPQSVRMACGPSAPQEKEKDVKNKTPIVPRKKKPEYVQIVYDIFAAYPRPVGKALGLRAIVKAFKGGVLPGTLLAYVHDYARSVAGKIADGDMEFIPHCATWMHGKRWEDKIPQTASDLFDEQFKKTTEEQAT